MLELTTARLRLRRLAAEDVEVLAAITDDDTVTQNLLKTVRPFTLQNARELIVRAQNEGPPVWGIDDGSLVGVLGLRGEFGFWLAKDSRGQGYGYEAGRAATNYAFKVLGYKRLLARPIEDNTASQRVLNRLGFRADGYERAALGIKLIWPNNGRSLTVRNLRSR